MSAVLMAGGLSLQLSTFPPKDPAEGTRFFEGGVSAQISELKREHEPQEVYFDGGASVAVAGYPQFGTDTKKPDDIHHGRVTNVIIK